MVRKQEAEDKTENPENGVKDARSILPHKGGQCPPPLRELSGSQEGAMLLLLQVSRSSHRSTENE